MTVFVVCCSFSYHTFAVHVGSGAKKGKGWKEDSPISPTKKAKNVGSKKQKNFHDASSSSFASSLPAISGQAPNSPGNWIPSDIDFGVVFYGF